MHKIMVSEEEATHCIRRGNYYVILPMLPELRKLSQNESVALKKEFSSKDAALNFTETIKLLKKHKIMIEDVDLSHGEELLR